MKEVELMEKEIFIVTTLDLEDKVFVVYIASISQNSNIYIFYRVWIAFLKADKAFNFVLSKYANFANIFFKNLAIKLPKHTEIHNYAIGLVKD